jgi:hypothetical protein
MWTLSWLKKTRTIGPICPLIGGNCLGAGCVWWQSFKCKDPQSNQVIDNWGCAVLWHNTLLTENSGLLDQAVKSIQSSRNENVKALGELRDALPGGRRKRG